jgi:HAE1 family hydrophobic/amphiphilic exporter-1
LIGSKTPTISLLAAIALLLALCAAPLSAAATRTLTLEEALTLAESGNHDIKQAREFSRLVEGKYLEERAAALPHLSVNGQIAHQDGQDPTPAGGGPLSQDNRSLSVNINQALFTWGKLGAAIRAAAKGFLTADEELRLARQETRRLVSTAFYDLLLAHEEEAIARQNQTQKESHRDEAARRLALGVATDYDLLAAKVAAENARPQVIRAANQVQTARDQLRFFIGTADEVEAVGPLVVAADPLPSFERALATAQERRPELLGLAHRQSIADEVVTIARAEDKPRLDLNGGYGQERLDMGDSSGSGPAWNAAVVFSFPFFDGLKTKGRVAQAESDRRALGINEAKLRESIALEIRTGVNLARETREIVTALGGTVGQAEELLAMAEKGFKLGVKIRLEVEDAELNLLQARGNLARARRDHLVARVGLERAMGVLGEKSARP